MAWTALAPWNPLDPWEDDSTPGGERNITIVGVTAPGDRWPTTTPADHWSAP